MVAANLSADSQPKSVGLGLRVGGLPALSLHSSNEPGELLQWLNIVVVIIIIIIKNLPEIFIMWVGIAEKVFKVRCQGNKQTN